MAIEIVDVPIKNGDLFHSYVSHYQRLDRLVVATQDGIDALLAKSPLAHQLPGAERGRQMMFSAGRFRRVNPEDSNGIWWWFNGI